MKYSVSSLTMSASLRVAFQIYVDNFVTFAVIVGIVWLPATLLSAFLGALLGKFVVAGVALSYEFFVALAMSIAISLPLLGSFVLQRVATDVAVAQACLGQKPTLAGAYQGALPRILDIVLVSLMTGFLIMCGAIAFIVPGIVLALRYAYALPIVLVEKVGPVTAMQRSTMLTEGRKGNLFWQLVVVSILTGIVVKFLGNAIAGSQVTYASQLLRSLPEVLLGPVIPIVVMLDYLGARTAKEGFGLEQLGASTGAPLA